MKFKEGIGIYIYKLYRERNGVYASVWWSKYANIIIISVSRWKIVHPVNFKKQINRFTQLVNQTNQQKICLL